MAENVMDIHSVTTSPARDESHLGYDDDPFRLDDKPIFPPLGLSPVKEARVARVEGSASVHVHKPSPEIEYGTLEMEDPDQSDDKWPSYRLMAYTGLVGLIVAVTITVTVLAIKAD